MAELSTRESFPDYMMADNQMPSEENINLFAAAAKGNSGQVKSLLQRGAKPNWFNREAEQKNALHIAAEYGHSDVVAILLEHGAVVNALAATDQTTALVLAGRSAPGSVIKLLLDAGATINAGNIIHCSQL